MRTVIRSISFLSILLLINSTNYAGRRAVLGQDQQNSNQHSKCEKTQEDIEEDKMEELVRRKIIFQQRSRKYARQQQHFRNKSKLFLGSMTVTGKTKDWTHRIEVNSSSVFLVKSEVDGKNYFVTAYHTFQYTDEDCNEVELEGYVVRVNIQNRRLIFRSGAVEFDRNSDLASWKPGTNLKTDLQLSDNISLDPGKTRLKLFGFVEDHFFASSCNFEKFDAQGRVVNGCRSYYGMSGGPLVSEDRGKKNLVAVHAAFITFDQNTQENYDASYLDVVNLIKRLKKSKVVIIQFLLDF